MNKNCACLPKAVVTSNNNEKKVYDSNIYLNNGEYFEFKFFNPLDEKIFIEISINGKTQNSKLVLQPGQKSIIDRFLDDNKKMIFKTYQYDSNDELAKEAIKNNGKLKFSFYKELILQTNTWNYDPYGLIRYTYPNPYTTIPHTTNPYDISFCSETGIIDKGKKSNQDFGVDYSTPEFVPFHTIEYNLLPHSQNINFNLIRRYCVYCGYRMRKTSWKYCPMCGEIFN